MFIRNDEHPEDSRNEINDMDKAAAVCSSSAAGSCSESAAAAQQQLQEPATAWSCVCSGKYGVRRNFVFALANSDQTFVGGAKGGGQMLKGPGLNLSGLHIC